MSDRGACTGSPNLKFLEGMAAEHCTKEGYNHEIVTTNYKLRTTPRAEWELVMARKGRSEEEFARILAEQFPGVGLGEGFHGRRVPDVVELMRLDSSIRAELAEVEVIVVVLYTGPLVREACDEKTLYFAMGEKAWPWWEAESSTNFANKRVLCGDGGPQG
jgi:hypothetical protein